MLLDRLVSLPTWQSAQHIGNSFRFHMSHCEPIGATLSHGLLQIVTVGNNPSLRRVGNLRHTMQPQHADSASAAPNSNEELDGLRSQVADEHASNAADLPHSSLAIARVHRRGYERAPGFWGHLEALT
jgi:hypothetical protein